MADRILFDSVRFVLRNWTVLQLAVQHGFGGIDSEQKAEWMVDVVNQVLRDNETLENYELGEYIEEILYNEFHTVADDGSLPKVAQKLCSFHRLWKDGHLQQIQEEIESTPSSKIPQCESGKTAVTNNVDSGDDDDDDDDSDDNSNAAYDSHNEQDQRDGSRLRQQLDQLHISPNTDCRPGCSSSPSMTDQMSNGISLNQEEPQCDAEDGWEVVRRSKKR